MAKKYDKLLRRVRESDENTLHRGSFLSLAALNAAHPTAEPGASADIDAGVGSDVKRYIWDNNDKAWKPQAGTSTQMTDAEVKAAYERNNNTNPFTDAEKTKLAGLTEGGALTIVEVTGTTQIVENGKLYVTNNADQIKFTLPADMANVNFAIIGHSASGYKIVSNSTAATQKVTYLANESGVSDNSETNLAIGADDSFCEFYGISSSELIASVFDNVSLVEGAKGFSYGTSRIEALNFTTETNASITPTISVGNEGYAGFNSAENGYIGRVDSTTALHKFNFSTEVNSSFGSWDTSHYGSSAGSSISLGKGFYANRTNVAKITFANDSVASISATLTGDNYQGGGGCSSPTKFYAMGTNDPASTRIESIVFSSEALVAVTDLLVAADTATSNGAGGGNTADGYCRLNDVLLNKIVYSTETVTAVAASINAQTGAAVTNSTEKLYIHGGQTSTVIRALLFADDTISALSATLGGNQGYTAGFQSGGLV